jgi:ABC-2 type transport system ATP-binding protein|uniref:ABC transporter ATP-binding protein n=1 Tax=Mesoaciditoga lauensis TaxID=1495039 RepID=A0A7V3RFB5_9BACT
MSSIVRFDNVKKIYSGDVMALKDVSFDVPAGSVFALLGPNGAGKTTALKIIMGAVKKTDGSVNVMGTDPFPDGNKDVSFVPEEKNLYDWMKASAMKKYFSTFAPNFSGERFDRISKRLDLTYRRRVKTLSQGNRTKLYLALALSQDVKLYVLDEPTWGLDPVVRAEVLELVKEIAKDGKTVIYSSHILSEVEEVCDRLLILKDGQVLYTGTMEDLKKDSTKNFSQTFLDLVRKGENE